MLFVDRKEFGEALQIMPMQIWGLKMWILTLSTVALFIKVKCDCEAITLIFLCLWLKFALRAKVFYAPDVSAISEESCLSRPLESQGSGPMRVPAQGNLSFLLTVTYWNSSHT